MKFYLIAGESSGDLYGSLLMEQILQLDPEAEFRYWGGPKMMSKGGGIFKNIRETSFMGLWEVAAHLPSILKLFRETREDIQEFVPDILILIDYPGFNLRMAKWAKKQGINVAYYISPQLWAWKAGRHKILKNYTDLFFVILPFERDFYRNLDTECIYVGHPLKEVINKQLYRQEKDTKFIGLFPGSRSQEIEQHLPVMIELVRNQPQYKFVVAGVSHIERAEYLKHIPRYFDNLDLIMDDSHKIMQKCYAAVAGSGTTTLELALSGVPQVVIYKTSPVSYFIGKQFIKVPYISLVNLIAQKQVVPELLQDEVKIETLIKAFQNILIPAGRSRILSEYDRISKELGEGEASKVVAHKIMGFLNH